MNYAVLNKTYTGILSFICPQKQDEFIQLQLFA